MQTLTTVVSPQKGPRLPVELLWVFPFIALAQALQLVLFVARALFHRVRVVIGQEVMNCLDCTAHV